MMLIQNFEENLYELPESVRDVSHFLDIFPDFSLIYRMNDAAVSSFGNSGVIVIIICE